MSMKLNVTNDETLTEMIILREGDEVAFQVDVSGVSTSLASPTMAFYKQNSGSDLSATYFKDTIYIPTGSINTIVTKVTQNLKKGDYTLSVNATVDGLVQNVCTTPVVVKRRNEL